jgi:LPXTG-site transpeptidase (sortase) family protein
MNKTQYFILIMIFVAIFTYGSLYLFNLVPESLKITNFANTEILPNSEDSFNQAIDESLQNENYTRPDNISIPKIGVNSQIEQPNSRQVSILDQYLSRGAVHYPGSGSIESGNIFLFGHSTGFQVVQNQAYKTFNGLNELVSGDEIILEADGKTYIYSVNSVTLVDEDEALVKFDNTARTLTISTCNSFGAMEERWVVQAEFSREV